jgi:hypothetical protein
MSRTYAVVRVDNSKYNETYSDPILKADSMEELQLKLQTKTGDEQIGAGLEDFGDFGGLF